MNEKLGKDALIALISALEQTGEAESAAKARDRLCDIDSPPLVFVIGEGNFGKSSAINALLGSNVAAVSRLPKTWKIDVYRPVLYGESEGAMLRLSDGTVAGPLSIADATARCDAAEAEAAAGRDPGITHAIWARSLPKNLGCWLVDTPGFAQFRGAELRSLFTISGLGSALPDESVVYDTYVHQADFLIWCIKSTKLEDADTESAMRDIARFGIPSAALITFIDMVPSANRASVCERAAAIYGSFVDRIMPFTSKLPEAEVAVASLWAYLADRGVTTHSIKKARHVAFLATESNGWVNRTEARVRAMADSISKTRCLRENIEAAIATSIKELDRELDNIGHGAKIEVKLSLDAIWDAVGGAVAEFRQKVLEHRALRVYADSLRRCVEAKAVSTIAKVKSIFELFSIDGIKVARDGRMIAVRRPLRCTTASDFSIKTEQIAFDVKYEKTLSKVFSDVRGEIGGSGSAIGELAAPVIGLVAAAVVGIWRAVVTDRAGEAAAAVSGVTAWIAESNARAKEAYTESISGIRSWLHEAIQDLLVTTHGFDETNALNFARTADKALACLNAAQFDIATPVHPDEGPFRFRRILFEQKLLNPDAWDDRVLSRWFENELSGIALAALQRVNAKAIALAIGPSLYEAAKFYRKSFTRKTRKSGYFLTCVKDFARRHIGGEELCRHCGCQRRSGNEKCGKCGRVVDRANSASGSDEMLSLKKSLALHCKADDIFREAYAKSLSKVTLVLLGERRPFSVDGAMLRMSTIVSECVDDSIQDALEYWCAPALKPTLLPRSRGRRDAEITAGSRAFCTGFTQRLSNVVVRSVVGAMNAWTVGSGNQFGKSIESTSRVTTVIGHGVDNGGLIKRDDLAQCLTKCSRCGKPRLEGTTICWTCGDTTPMSPDESNKHNLSSGATERSDGAARIASDCQDIEHGSDHNRKCPNCGMSRLAGTTRCWKCGDETPLASCNTTKHLGSCGAGDISRSSRTNRIVSASEDQATWCRRCGMTTGCYCGGGE